MHPELQDDLELREDARVQTVVSLRARPPPRHSHWVATSRPATVDDPFASYVACLI